MLECNYLFLEDTTMNKNKIQSLVNLYLKQYGKLEILLPDGVVLEIGTVSEDQHGNLIKNDDYCWVIASRDGRSASIDAFNAGVSFIDDNTSIVFEDSFTDYKGDNIRKLEIL